MKYNTKEKEFKEWFDGLGLKHFSAVEFIRYARRYRGKVQNSLPPKSKWKNLTHALFIVDMLRGHFGKSCTILSSYRSPAYNRAVGGAKNSQHLQHTALDITFSGVTPRRVYNKLMEWRKAGLFKGGLGLYTGSNFVHIDTRGYNTQWGK